MQPGHLQSLKVVPEKKPSRIPISHSCPRKSAQATGPSPLRPRVFSGDGAAIEAKNLTKRFGDFTAVKDVSFTIPKGEIFGFVGSNGCGKTTTMKMLTGLLPPTHGEAYLFGKPIEAGSIELRKRIGYMSQMFSLYGELTVRQNLEMHAHLFDLPASGIPGRVRKMADLFDLHDAMEDQTERLPLGIRQRLSLAVAAIHEPEILILDEPTSGVDPVARDHFWEMLIKLSRENGVTIFVTTHYMNEASRCDRVALMSMGCVLACDCPDVLIRERNCRTLEETFIACMKEDMERNGTVLEMDGERQGIPLMVFPEKTHKQKRNFDISRLAALARRETVELFRDPVRLITSFVIAPILLIVFGYGISIDIENIRFSTLDYDRTGASRAYVESFSGTRYFKEQAPIESPSEWTAGSGKENTRWSSRSRPGSNRDLKRGRSPEVALILDGTMPFRAETSKNYAEAVHLLYLADLQGRAPGGAAFSTVKVQPRYWYNQMVRSRYSHRSRAAGRHPGARSLHAHSHRRGEGKGARLHREFLLQPDDPPGIPLGKAGPLHRHQHHQLPCARGVMLFLFRIPFKGSLPACSRRSAALYHYEHRYRLFISTFTQTQIAALVAAFVITLVPSV